MCGRYYIEIDESELREICAEVQKNSSIPEQMSFKTSGEIFPTNVVPVQTGVSRYQPMIWGFSGFNKRPVINARSETALAKPMFQKPMIERRCIIPATGYYEWQKDGNQKIKHQFYLPGQPLYMAGCFRQEKDNPLCSFVILTKEAVNGLEKIHDRMPVIIPQNHIQDWFDEGLSIIGASVNYLAYRAI